MEVELVLIGGERRKVVLPSHTGSIPNVLDRLEEWIETQDGGWVQKKFIVEVRPCANMEESAARGGSEEELHQLREAAESLADEADG